MAEAKQKSNLVLIREFFGTNLAEMKAQVMGDEGMSKEAIAQLGDGIRDGSLTY